MEDLLSCFFLSLLFCVPTVLCEEKASQSIEGFEFKDNLLENRFGPQNGYATVKINPLSKQMSTCFRVFVEFARFGDQVGLMQFGNFLNYGGKYIFATRTSFQYQKLLCRQRQVSKAVFELFEDLLEY